MAGEGTEFLTEDEAEALNTPPQENTETETTSTEETPEKVEETVTPEEEAKPEETVETKAEETGTKPEEKVEEPPKIDGILTKDGKHFMPFNVLEQERQKRQALEAENAELKKPKPEVAKPIEPKQPERVATTQPDFKAMASKLYESADGAAEVLQAVFDLGKQEVGRLAPDVVSQATMNTLWAAKTETIKAQNTWLTPESEELVAVRARNKMASDANFNPRDINALAKIADDSVKEVKALLRIDEPKFDRETELKKMRETVTQEVMQKFNISKPKVATLSGARNVNPDATSKFDRLKQLEGIEYEEAYAALTPQEKESWDNLMFK